MKVFSPPDQTLDGDHLAATFRNHLQKAGVTRAELFERTAKRTPIRAHDLRATFVTLALANNKTETWICDRTGHRSSQMLNRYRRSARTAAELGLGWLTALDESIPELASGRTGTQNGRLDGQHEPDNRAPMPDGLAGDARRRLVISLVDAVRELLLAGDAASARVVLGALLELTNTATKIEQKAVRRLQQDPNLSRTGEG